MVAKGSHKEMFIFWLSFSGESFAQRNLDVSIPHSERRTGVDAAGARESRSRGATRTRPGSEEGSPPSGGGKSR